MVSVEGKKIAEFAQDYVQQLTQLLDTLDLKTLAKIIAVLENTRLNDGTIYIMGNGGSAATASHMALDLSFCTRMRDGPRMRAISLTNSSPYLTAAANDLDFNIIFEEQLRDLLRQGDVVIAISASGNSENVVRAVNYANAQNATTISLVGFDGGQLREISDITLHTPSEKGDYGPVEDIHMILDHLITAYFLSEG